MKHLGTKGHKSQSNYDNLLSEMSISSLRFEVFNNKKKVNEYKNTKDLNNKDNLDTYMQMRQRYVMACEEYNNRVMDRYASTDYEQWFDIETGNVMGNDNEVLYTMDFNENEDGYVMTETENVYEDIIVSEIDEKPKERTRREIYKDWNY